MTPNWGWVLLVVQTLLGLGAAWHALLNKRDSRSALGWMVVALGLPIAGPVAYLLFGINRVRARARRSSRPSPAASAHPRSPDDAGLPVSELSDLARAGAVISGMPLRPGNRIAALHNGEQAYPAMLEAIAAAAVGVDLSTYIFENNATGHRFVDALVAAQQRGVRVRVLLDGMGEWYSPGIRRRLRRGGLDARSFNAPRLLPLNLAVNLRNHRKLLVVDGVVAFAGGINIGDRHLLAPPRTRHPVADLHFQLRGPAVADLQRVFTDTWRQAGGEPSAAADAKEMWADASAGLAGPSLCRVIADGPDETLDQLALVLQSAVSAARRSVRIMTPYFLPSRELIAGLQSAALRGVAVTILLPARSNLPYVHWATRNLLWELLHRDVRVFYQPAPFNHGKLLVVDEGYVLVGSANIDPRSLRLNYELGVEVFDPAFGAEMSGVFDALVARSRPVTDAELAGRALAVRTRDALCWLFSPYL
ncbi:MAG: cardiolipin synthase [Porticoccaceae bacterium]|nr:MAG: cardiolipin synthase [Porticoccaceae bacterium]